MAMILSPETVQRLEAFLAGRLPPGEFGAWIASAETDDTVLDSERDALTQLRLVLVEYGEGLRTFDEVVAEAAGLLATTRKTFVDLTSSNAVADIRILPAFIAKPALA